MCLSMACDLEPHWLRPVGFLYAFTQPKGLLAYRVGVNALDLRLQNDLPSEARGMALNTNAAVRGSCWLYNHVTACNNLQQFVIQTANRFVRHLEHGARKTATRAKGSTKARPTRAAEGKTPSTGTAAKNILRLARG